MCVIARVDGVWCENVREFKEAMGCIVPCDLYEFPPEDEDCLCGVDIEKTIELVGAVGHRDDATDWHIKTKENRRAVDHEQELPPAS